MSSGIVDDPKLNIKW